MDTSVRRGDIFYADLSPVVGSEQGGTRPVLIVHEEAAGTDPAERRTALLQQLSPLMKTLPRGQQITDVILTAAPLPRTATGKIKRYELSGLF